MQPLFIVKAQILPQSFPRFARGRVIFEIHLLIFDGAPQALGKNVVQGTPLAIHADAHITRAQQLRVRRASKVAALIAITNPRHGLRQRSLQSFQHKADLQGLIEFPTDHIA